MAWVIERRQAAHAAKQGRVPVTPEGEMSKDEAERRKILASARLAEIALAKEMERVVPVDMLNEIVGQELGRFKSNFRELPAKLRPALRQQGFDRPGQTAIIGAFSEHVEDALAEIKSYE
jgi:hypothetical protein